MKKYYLAFLIISIFLFVNGCSEEEVETPQPVTTDISVISSESLIFWINNDDLTQKINNALTYNYGNALESEIEKKLTFNSDSTQVTATINFKQEFQNNYYDPNISNNSILIELNFGIEVDPINANIQNEFYNPASAGFLQNVDLVLANSPLLDLSTEPIYYVPIKFHDILKNNGSGISLNSNYIPTLLQRLNSKFSTAKIEFIQCGDVNQINNSDWYDFPAIDYSGINGVDFSYLENIMNIHNVPNVLNIYFPNSINGVSGFYPGIEQVPHLESMLAVDKGVLEVGLVVEHEIGHWLYLPHTHGNGNIGATSDELVNGTNCSIAGDRICDTPADPNLYGLVTQDGNCNYIGNLVDANGAPYIPDTTNIMSYTYYECRNSFSIQQLQKMGLLMRSNLRNFINSSNCINSNSTISLSGNINFGNIPINTTSSSQTLTISNTGNESFNIQNIISSNSAFTIVNGQSITLQPNSSIDIQIQFTPTQEQNYSAIITVENDADTGNNTIQVTGTGINNTSNTSTISLSGNLNFGNVEVGQSENRSFTISNTGNQSFNVSSISFPSGVFSANWNSGTINSGGSQNVTVTFQPTNVQSYNGTVTVNHNADGGNNTISIDGSGFINNTGQPNLRFYEYRIDDDHNNNNDIIEAGEDIDFDIRLENFGNATATNIEVIINTNDPDITMIDNDGTYDDMPQGDLEWNGGAFDFEVSPSCPTKSVIFTMQINSNEGSWSDTFTINIQGQNSSNPMPITPSNGCSSAPIMQVNTEYIVDINTSNYTLAPPIDGRSSGGNNVRGFWLSFQVPSDWDANHDFKIYDVSSNFDPVFGIRANCNGPYLGQINGSGGFNDYVDDSGTGGNETSNTNLPGNNSSDNIYHVRIYHYNGSQAPNISFKIIIE